MVEISICRKRGIARVKLHALSLAQARIPREWGKFFIPVLEGFSNGK